MSDPSEPGAPGNDDDRHDLSEDEREDQPASAIIPALALAVYERSDGWHSPDEVRDVIEDYGENALWEGQLGPMLDEVTDNLTAHRTDYRRRTR